MRGCTRLASDSLHSDDVIRDRERGTFAGMINATRVGAAYHHDVPFDNSPIRRANQYPWRATRKRSGRLRNTIGRTNHDLNEPTWPHAFEQR